MGDSEPPVRTPTTNIMNFGAVGDGVADDSDALDRAVRGTPPGGVLLLPKGTYKLTRPIKIFKKSMVIKGEGRDLTTLYYPYSFQVRNHSVQSKKDLEHALTLTSAFSRHSSRALQDLNPSQYATNNKSFSSAGFFMVMTSQAPPSVTDPLSVLSKITATVTRGEGAPGDARGEGRRCALDWLFLLPDGRRPRDSC